MFLKVFDNRSYPTSRRPDEWLNQQRPWIAKLGVETKFEFKESSANSREAGTSDRKRSWGGDIPKGVRSCYQI